MPTYGIVNGHKAREERDEGCRQTNKRNQNSHGRRESDVEIRETKKNKEAKERRVAWIDIYSFVTPQPVSAPSAHFRP